MIDTLTYSDYESVDETYKIVQHDVNNISSHEIDEMKHFLFLITQNHYTNTEIIYIIKNRLLEYD